MAEKIQETFYALWNLFERYVLGVVLEMQLVDFIDIIILTIIIFSVYKFIRERRAVRLLRGLMIVIAVLLISVLFDLKALKFILENFYQVGMIAILIIFQSDLRAALERFGTTNLKTLRSITEGEYKEIVNSAEIMAEAATSLARSQTGALIVIERSTKLGEYLSQGVILNAELSSLLIRNIFYDKAPMHDGAVIIRKNRIYAAGCYLPLSKEDVNKDLGTRHRAAIGLSEVSDALVIVVSEETSTISVAYDGKLERNFNYSTLKQMILKYMLPADIKKVGIKAPKVGKKRKSRKKGEETDE